jgi:hypothetical protein
MDTYYLQVFPKTHEVPFLRLFSPDKSLIDERPIDRTAIDHFTAQVEEGYVKIMPNLSTLGQLLYAWMDGPTQRWLESLVRHHRPGLALHIDVDERLRHLPWELMAPASQQFLCGHALQPFTPGPYGHRSAPGYPNRQSAPACAVYGDLARGCQTPAQL